MSPDEIKQQTDLTEYIREQGLELTKHGTNDLKCLCPFHNDTNPSLVISPKKKLFNCPSCGTGGSVIDFVMKFHKLELPQALKQLEERLSGVKVVTDSDGGRIVVKEDVRKLSPDKEAQLLERVVTFYEKAFSNNPNGTKYLNERGITDNNLFSKHRIGYADGSLLKALPKDGEILEELEILGVLTKGKQRYSERFRNCVVFPVFDIHGNITTLYGRHTGNGAKRHVYLPDRPTGLWNVQCIKSYDEVALVESVFDALSMEMGGISNAVSVQGTNGLKGTDLDLLKENGIKHIDVVFDADDAGKKAADKLYTKIYADKAFESYSYFFLADSNDPNQYLIEYGADRLGNHIRYQSERQRIYNSETAVNPVTQTKNGFTARLSFAYEVSGLDKAPRRLRATIRVENKGLFHIDTVDLYSSRQRRTFAQDICRIFETQPDIIEVDILKIVKICEEQSPTDSAENETDEATVVISPKDRTSATEFGKQSDLVEQILKDFETCGLVGETSNKLLGYLAMTSRKMDDPLSILILSSSGAGKSALQDTVLEFCPPEDLVKLTNLSGKALFYKESNSLKHKVLALEEGAGAEDASYAIRNLISADGLTTESTVRDPQTGRLTTMENKVEGPTSVFCTTTQPDIDPETKSRFIVTGIDESREQTRRILHFQRKRHSVDGLKKDLQADNVTRKHRNFQRLLRPYKIVNPFAEKLRYEDDRLQGRRAQPQYLSLINAMAFLRQMCKQSQKVKMYA